MAMQKMQCRDVCLLILIVSCSVRGSRGCIIIGKIRKLIILMLLTCGISKRAQIPFSCWLPAAIIAPTPISSFVHSSTLVTAGIYLFIRYNEIIMNKSVFNNNF